MEVLLVVVIAVLVLLFLAGIRIVRPTNRALVERFGKYHHFAGYGFNWIIPGVDQMYKINITEQMIKIFAAVRIILSENKSRNLVGVTLDSSTSLCGCYHKGSRESSGPGKIALV